MLSLELIKELSLLLECCSDSDIEDFIDDHHLSDEEATEVWKLVAINNAPYCCKDCKNVIFYNWYIPCVYCIRPVQNRYKDYYKKDEQLW